MATEQSTHLFTCISCSIAFPSADEQRDHYRSDHHRYNMKRRVAGLPPISVTLFNQRVLERKAETAITTTPKSMTCDLCNKAYTSENGYRTHLQSKKHKERELKGPISKAKPVQPPVEQLQDLTIKEEPTSKDVENKETSDQEGDEYMQSIDAKIAAARARFDNLEHMSVTHSFFVPDIDYLTDLSGLIAYLGEKIAVGNVCIYFEAEEAEWEDVSDDGEDDEDMEIVDEDASSEEEDVDDDSQLTYGDSPFELVLPSGARIGHRSMRRYYAQSFRPVGNKKEEDPNTGAALVRRLLADKNSELVPVKGGFGAFGAGGQVVKARNRGEAKEAGRHVKEFRDMKRREDFKTKMGFVGNNQKHFRDPLLQ
ncbi:hypothetical protein FA13DRAFT_1786751 [Coprinellus micaceus]|uniref:C2H2-type domain-containing protein n=1 Tax=Coprinellus micaceus TaxID=71717 RepID=A0A4Y7TTU0_COPMI|nr:hypothetical protein FA13DRAFT_1786751 [Coprinellus micaceus]